MKEKEKENENEKETETETGDGYRQALAILTELRGKFVSEKEYPMPDSYKKQTAQLLKLLEIREKIDKQREFMTPEHRRETVEKSAELGKKIDDYENQIAAHYEIHQLLRTIEEEMQKIDARQMVRIHKMYIYLKYRAPKEKFDEFIEIVNILSPEERENFYDQVAILEAGDLIRLIAKEGETREQTEEFLKNYRAAENKRL